MRACVPGVSPGVSGRPGGQIGKVLAHQGHQAVVREVAGGGDHQVGGRIHGAVVSADRRGIEAADRLASAEDGLAERVVFPEVGGEDLVDQVIRAVGLHFDLFENDALFLLDVLLGEPRIEHQVGQDVEGLGEVLVQDLGVEADQFLAGKGVEVAADGVHRARDVFGGAMGGALEEHVLDEVRDAVLLGRFLAGPGVDPHAHRDRAHVGHGFGNHADAVRERGHIDVPKRAGGGCHCL